MSDKKHDRSRQVLHLLLQKGTTTIEDLAALVGVSSASVRRDLIRLESEGLVQRRHGGVDLAGSTRFEPFRFDAAFSLREERFTEEKRRIALAAAKLIEEGEVVAISPGTTTTQLARNLRHRDGLHLVTTALNIGMELSAYANLRVTLTGGSVRWPGSFSMVGATAFHSIERLHFDKAILGCTGLHPEHGLTVIESDEALILGAMVRSSRRVIAIADSSKLGITGANRVCETSQIHTIVTDESASASVVEAFQQRQVQVLLV